MKRLFIVIAVASVLITSSCSSQNDGLSHDSERNAFSSLIAQENCLLCGDNENHEISSYLGQDNVGLIDVNSFDVLQLEVNRYDHNGQLIEEATGSTRMGLCEVGNCKNYVVSDVDRGYARVDITLSGDGVDPEAIGHYLCKACLDTYTSYAYGPITSEIAVINFSTRDLRPLEQSCPWFTFDNFLIDCTFEDECRVDLRVTYRPLRYQE